MNTIPENLVPEGARLPGDRPSPNGGTPPSGSMLARLRDAAGRQREQRRVELDVPGAFAGQMRIRYHGISMEKVERYAELLDRKQTTQGSMNIDMIAQCADAVLGREDDGRWTVIEDEQGPVGLDERLARLLGIPEPAPGAEISSDEVIRALFVIDGNAWPLIAHSAALLTWLQASEGLDPGESSAGSGSPTSASQSLSASPPS